MPGDEEGTAVSDKENQPDIPPGDAKEVVQIAASGDKNSVPQDLFVKHPLQHEWHLYYCKNDRQKAWEECLKEVTTFKTVEDFWALYNHIQLASGLPFSSDYYLFKTGIKPMWEDPRNVAGGRWLITVDKQARNELLDHYWLELIMAMIGEQFDDCSDLICGAVVNCRNKGDKVSLWTGDSVNMDANKKIGMITKQKLGIVDSIVYEAHRDTQQKSSSLIKCRMKI